MGNGPKHVARLGYQSPCFGVASKLFLCFLFVCWVLVIERDISYIMSCYLHKCHSHMIYCKLSQHVFFHLFDGLLTMWPNCLIRLGEESYDIRGVIHVCYTVYSSNGQLTRRVVCICLASVNASQPKRKEKSSMKHYEEMHCFHFICKKTMLTVRNIW